jgi:uncharacterized protein (DUF2126 family)
MYAFPSEQWQSINTLGQQVDLHLNRLGVGLTMGGEPTYVSATDFESQQWRFAALGEDKRRLAEQMLRKLRDRFAPAGALLHYGLGKQYPGEPYPRWALGCFWREDGKPLWHHGDSLYNRACQSLTIEDGYRFIQKLAQQLGIPLELVIPAYESDAPDPTGFVLPVLPIRQDGATVWASCRWALANETTSLILISSHTSVGMRLPLGQLVEPSQLLDEAEQSLDAPPTIAAPEPRMHATNSIQVALCIEVQDDYIRVFIPPMTYVRGYVDLLAAVEQVATALGYPVIIEGYRPPANQGIQGFQITPDPGVLEVNIHPAATWEELVHIHTTLDEVAKDLGLGTIKFARDGRFIGTGGGSHITLGGSHPTQSPLLRRPDLLQSFITYWQHHPSLSYLFAGEFVGPTCQSPRVDESLHDNLYHLELAFQALVPDRPVPPEVVDHLLRPLLVDITGNAHRTAFCIDKLFPSHAPVMQLGLLELRGFEMPPTSQLRLLQMLLVRACLAWFWETPYRQPLKRWGATLYDRFMLPHYLETDLATVLEELQQAGYPLQQEWFQPFWDFRFPHHGQIQLAHAPNLCLELRHALEPWPVMEPLEGGGTSRVVDDSMARIEVKLKLPQEQTSGSETSHQRYTLLCNGRRVPLQPIENSTNYVAGVRYRARSLHWKSFQRMGQGCAADILDHLQNQFQPPAQLHFEVFDCEQQQFLGGCAYQVAYDDGGDYLTWPTSASEAQQRWQGRVVEHCSPAVSSPLPELAINPYLPFTLDLRYPHPAFSSIADSSS